MTDFADTIRSTWNDNTLFTVLLELTYACNLDCSYCYNDLSLTGAPLSFEQYSDLLHDLADMNVMNITLSGGEPLAHPRFFDIGKLARELGFVVRIKSNGHALKERMARRVLEEIDPFIIDLSLHGSTPEVHDRQTRVPGSFQRLVDNMKVMKEIGLRMKVNCCMTRWNQHQVKEMYAICDEIGVPLVIDPEVKPRDDGDISPLDINPTPEAIIELKQYLEERAGPKAMATKKTRAEAFAGIDKNCGAGSSGLCVDPFGAVLPCVQWRRSIGSLHDARLPQIWTSPELEEVRDITRQAKTQVDALGDAAEGANYCPGTAHAHSGDPLKAYPAFIHRIGLADRPRIRLNIVQ